MHTTSPARYSCLVFPVHAKEDPVGSKLSQEKSYVPATATRNAFESNSRANHQ
jgi:hypothetical protein